MPIHIVFKKSMLLALFTVAIILTLFSASSKVHAKSEPNLALNLNPNTTEFPKLTASYTCCGDSVWYAVDGLISYGNAQGNRWTSYGSGNAKDWLSIDFGSAKSFNQVKLYVYDDGGGVQPPTSYLIQYWDAAVNAWVDTTNQTKTPTKPAAALNTVNFVTVTSQKLQIVFTNNTYSGVVELEVFNNQPLLSTIAAANAIYDQAVVGTLTGQYSSDSKATLAAAIVAAQGVANNPNADQAAADAALNSAISDFKASVIPLESFYSAFSNAAGDVITLYVSNILNTSYTLNAANFKIYNGSDLYSNVSSVAYNDLDSSISLTLATPLSGDFASLKVNLLKNAFQTNLGDLSSSMSNLPIIQASQLDLNGDHRIGIEDLFLLLSSHSALNDINHDHYIDNTDAQILLKQIMPL